MIQQTIVRVLIRREDRILLVRSVGASRNESNFSLPGSVVTIGEGPIEAIKRGVKEQLGLSLGIVQIEDVLSFIDTDLDIHNLVILYSAALSSERTKVNLEDKHSAYSWKKMTEIQHSQLDNLTVNILKKLNGDLLIDEETIQGEITEDKKTTANKINPKSVIIYADGGSRGNPGPSASGFVIMTTDEEVVYEGGKYLGITTNNQAEYHAVRLGLEKALEMNVRRVQFRLDSMLVVNQMTGVYQIKNRDLWPIHSNIKELIKRFESVHFTHIRREFNKLADGMVNQILDQQM